MFGMYAILQDFKTRAWQAKSRKLNSSPKMLKTRISICICHSWNFWNPIILHLQWIPIGISSRTWSTSEGFNHKTTVKIPAPVALSMIWLTCRWKLRMLYHSTGLFLAPYAKCRERNREGMSSPRWKMRCTNIGEALAATPKKANI